MARKADRSCGSHNAGTRISEAIESLPAQTFREFGYINSDDGSSDGTPKICRSYAMRALRKAH